MEKNIYSSDLKMLEITPKKTDRRANIQSMTSTCWQKEFRGRKTVCFAVRVVCQYLVVPTEHALISILLFYIKIVLL